MIAPGKAKTVVSVTPLQVERDSRTFKEAASVARFGYLSVVVELYDSDLSRTSLPFELYSVLGVASCWEGRSCAGEASAGGGNRFRWASLLHWLCGAFLLFWRAWRSAILRLPGSLQRPLRQATGYVQNYWIRSLQRIPPASLYYLHGYEQFPAVYALCKLHGARYVYDAHDYYPSLYQCRTLFQRLFVSRFRRSLESLCIRHAAAVVTVSDGIAELLWRTYGRRALIIQNTHDHRLDRDPGENIREGLRLAPDDFLMVAVCRPLPGRATQQAIDALSFLPPSIHLAFVGHGYEQHRASLHGAAVEHRVHFLDARKPDELVPFICAADVAILLYHAASDNYANALPNGFFQAIAAGLPLLYPQLTEIKKVAEQWQLGAAIDPLSPVSIAQAALRMSEARQELSIYERNTRRAAESLNWERDERSLRELVTGLLVGAR